MTGRLDRAAVLGLAFTVVAALIYWLSGKDFDSGRDDFFYLAEAFLQGRTWLDRPLGPADVIPVDGRFYVPFAPFPAIAFMPLVAVVGPQTADQFSSLIQALLAAGAVGLCWMLVGRLGVESLVHRFWLVVLFGFGTTLWWVTTRGGVWHTGQIIATILTLGCLIELWGRRRAWLIGLMAGAAFLTRAPLAFAVPFYLLLLAERAEPAEDDHLPTAAQALLDRWPVRDWGLLVAGSLPAVAFFLWYNAVRFGDPLESGYALATLPDWLAARRQLGLFSLTHVGMNVDLLLFKLPEFMAEFPFFRPDGVGMSVLFTSPGLLLFLTAPWRDRRTWWLLGAVVAVLVPTLLYYGGGWLQYGYRYFLDSIPFLLALAALGVARRGLAWPWVVLILWSVLIGLGGVYWVDKI